MLEKAGTTVLEESENKQLCQGSKKYIYIGKKVLLHDHHWWQGGAQEQDPAFVKGPDLAPAESLHMPCNQTSDFHAFCHLFNEQRNSEEEKGWLFPPAHPRCYNLKPSSGNQSVEKNPERIGLVKYPAFLGE